MVDKVFLLVVGLLLLVITGAFLLPNTDFEMEYCNVCAWNYAEMDLEDGEFPSHARDYTIHSVLGHLWNKYNQGGGQRRNEKQMKFLEDIRTKYNFSDIQSFYDINFSNPKPNEPDLKYLGTGYIVGFTDWSYDGPAYSITVICINGTNYTYNNCRWNPYPYNKSSLTHVFKRRDSAWRNQFKEASLYDASIYFDLPESVNATWDDYYNKLDIYYKKGGQ